MSRCEICTRRIRATEAAKGKGGRPVAYCSRTVCRETYAIRVRWERTMSALSFPATDKGRAALRALHAANMKTIQKGLYGRRTYVDAALTAEEGAALFPPLKRESPGRPEDCTVCGRPVLVREPGSRGRPPLYCEHRGPCCEARSARLRLGRCLRAQTVPDTTEGREAAENLRNTLLAEAWSIYDDHREALDSASENRP